MTIRGGEVVLGMVLSATAMVVGVVWDISWDASIGADSFWSPPHMAINFGAAAAGLFALGGLLASGGHRHSAVVRVGTGAVVWGAVAMLGWVILDDWWGQAYGLFGERWSPPELLFTVSAAVILFGTAAAVSGDAQEKGFPGAFWVAGIAMVFGVAAMTPYGLPNLHRTATFYLVVSAVFPAILLVAARATEGGWGATRAACVYSATICGLVWILPRFAARPTIGPIYQPIEAFLPPSFPLLLIAPALAMDWVLRRLDGEVSRVAAAGAVFVLSYLPVQWLFASFLLSPMSDNAFFAGGGRHWPFYAEIGPERSLFWGTEQDPIGLMTIAGCFVAASVSSRIGLSLGAWMVGSRR